MAQQVEKIDTTLPLPPGPKGLPIIGNIASMNGRDILRFNYDLWREYGDIFFIKQGPIQNVVIAKPEHIQHVLVKNVENYSKGFTVAKLRMAIGNGIFNAEGDHWRKQRRLMQPIYTPRAIEQFADIMSSSSLNVIERWSQFGDDASVNINHEMILVTMSIISRSMFGLDLGVGFKELSQALHGFLDWVSSSTLSFLDLPLYIPTPKNQKIKRDKAIVREHIFKVIQQRRAESEPKEDLLQLLMTAVDEETGKVMDDEQLYNELLITFFAGHETTATTLTWAWYLLSQHPTVEAKFHEELEAVLGGRTPTLADMEKLKYTRMIVDETLRLYSPVSLTARVSIDEDEIDGYHIPADTMISILPYATHRHPDYWEHPLAFYPEHFTPEAVQARHRYAYYPFGAGQRICIGMHFALMEAVIVLATLGQKFRPRLASINHGEIRFTGVLRPVDDIMMSLEKR